MKVSFCRYSATGNTFLIFDSRDALLSSISKNQMQSWCESHHVDGLLFLEESSEPKADFHMRYVNADGGEVEMCGNGARSILHFAGQELKITPKKGDSFSFTTMNSLYQGKGEGQFPLLMTEIKDWGLIDVSDLYETEFSYYLNTGVPHTLFQVENLNSIDLIESGRRIRYDERFSKGTNANFFQIEATNKVRVRTYERGVEGETQSCGTGATAVALSLGKLKGWGPRVEVEVPGGQLVISFNEDFSEVYLEGPVDLKERGFIEI